MFTRSKKRQQVPGSANLLSSTLRKMNILPVLFPGAEELSSDEEELFEFEPDMSHLNLSDQNKADNRKRTGIWFQDTAHNLDEGALATIDDHSSNDGQDMAEFFGSHQGRNSPNGPNDGLGANTVNNFSTPASPLSDLLDMGIWDKEKYDHVSQQLREVLGVTLQPLVPLSHSALDIPVDKETVNQDVLIDHTNRVENIENDIFF